MMENPPSEPVLKCARIPRSFKAKWTLALYIKALLRFLFILINNIYGIPTYLVVVLITRPLLWSKKTFPLYWSVEGYMFKFLLMQVGSWLWSADYKVCDVGEDIGACMDEPCLILSNHQSTGDVPLLMHSIQNRGSVANKVMWIMDIMFKYSSFGFVSQVHGDFFIQQGKATRHLQISRLREHLLKDYTPRERKWIVLFPEGGFLRKRRETSQKYAAKQGFPMLEHVTLPRVGAMKCCLDTLAHLNGHSNHNATTKGSSHSRSLKWIVDVTIGYPQGQPLDMFAILFGHRPPCESQLLYRLYPVDQVPTDEEGLLQWIYQRYMDKERMLDEFYATGEFPPLDPNNCHGHVMKRKRYTELNFPAVFILNLVGILTMAVLIRVTQWAITLDCPLW